MDGIERLEQEAIDLNNPNITAVFNYLKSKEAMQEKLKNPEKSLKQMYEFMYKKSEQFRVGTVAMVADNLVYLWATQYFNQTNEELGLNKKEQKIENETPKPTEAKKEETKPEEKKAENSQISLFSEEAK